MQFLSSDKNLRGTVNGPLNTTNLNFNHVSNVGYADRLNSTMGNGLSHNYHNSEFNWGDQLVLKKIVENNLVFANNHTPTHSNSPSWDIFGYNRLDKNVIGETPAVLGGKEEFAPEYLFSSY
jgi:hypothetical protein